MVAALFYNVAVVHNEDNVRILDSRKSVSDNKAGLALHKLDKRTLNSVLGAEVDRARSLIENKHGRIH